MQKQSLDVVTPTLFVTLFSLLNYGLAFLAQIITAYYYGNNVERDAYLIALTIPTYIISIFIAALPSVFLPALIELRNESSEKFWYFAANFFYFCLVGLFIILAICIIFAHPITKLIAPDISSGTLRLAESLYIIIVPSIVFNVFSGLLGSLYYSEYKFLRPAFAPVINSLVALIGILALNGWIGIYSLAVGFLAGSIASVLFLSPIIKNFPFSVDVRDQNLYKLLRAASPLILAGIIYQSVTIVQRRFASMLPIGSISSLGYSMQIITVLASLLSGGIATILFPLMSNAWAENDLSSLRKYFSIGIIVILVITIPFAGFFGFLGLPFIRIIFERGAFKLQDSINVSSTLFILSGALVFYSLGNIAAKGFYFSGRTSWVALQETLILLLYLYLGYTFSAQWSVAGLALATTLCAGISVFFSFLFMKYLIKDIGLNRILTVLIEIVISTIVSSLLAFAIYTVGNHIGGIFILIIASSVQIALYYSILVFVFKIPELLFIQNKLVRYIRNALPVL